MSHFDAVFNLGLKATRRLQSAHKPLVRLMRRNARAGEHRAFRQDAEDIDRQIAACASGTGPIVVGPWLAEVGYEVLYWIPFVRWFPGRLRHSAASPRRRLAWRHGVGISRARGNVCRSARSVVAGGARRAQRRTAKRRRARWTEAVRPESVPDEEIVAAVRARVGIGEATVLHPSLMFRLFRHVWYDNLPFDVLWRHTRYVTADRATAPPLPVATVSLPDDFIAVKVYGGPALGTSEATRGLVRDLVARAAAVAPVVVLESEHGLDEHRDFDFDGLPHVTSAKMLMTPRTNLGVQLALVARSRFFLSACGGLAWLTPFLGVPTVALYEQDRLLAPHLFVARQAGARAGAAEFTPLDLRGLDRLHLPAPS